MTVSCILSAAVLPDHGRQLIALDMPWESDGGQACYRPIFMADGWVAR